MTTATGAALTVTFWQGHHYMGTVEHGPLGKTGWRRTVPRNPPPMSPPPLRRDVT